MTSAEAYCLKCKAKRAYKHGTGKLEKTKNGKYIFYGKCNNCDTKMSKFVSATEGKGLLSMLGIPMPDSLKNIPVLGSLLF